METFAKLFGSLLALVYHCFDRIFILGHLPLLTRPDIVCFFRDVHHVGAITEEVLRQRTNDYHRWVDAFASNHKIPMEWAEKGVRKEDYVRPALRRMERRNQFGVYFILKSLEVGPSFRSAAPRFPVDDPTTASSADSVPATLTIISTFATKCSGQCLVRGIVAACLATLVVLLFSPLALAPVSAQVTGATLSGTVTDQSGAVVPKAGISIKNIATAVTRGVTTDPAGF